MPKAKNGMKKCSTCSETKSVSEFHKKKKNADGLKYCCKKCLKEKQATYYQENKESLKNKRTSYYQENKESVKRRIKRWQQLNPEKTRAASKRWRKANPEKARAFYAAWYAANRDKISQYKKKDRTVHALKHEARRAVHSALRTGQLSKQPCSICATSSDIEAHHPSYAKKDHLKIVWLCRRCHRQLHKDLGSGK